jgi:hypothetical protein
MLYELSERVSAEAREIHPGRILLTMVAAFFYALGWSLGKLVNGVLLTVTWSMAAAKVGWQDARRSYASAAVSRRGAA